MNYSTLPTHKNYKFPSEYDIEVAIDNLGYDYFLPRKILSDLICLYSHYMSGDPVDKILNRSPLTSDLKEFYSTLAYELYSGSNPLNKSILTLKELSKEVDFQKMEIGINFKVPSKNCVVEQDEFTELILKCSEKELSHEEEAKLSKLLLKMTSALPTIKGDENNKKYVKRIKNYQDIFKIKKSSLVRPDFKYKLVNKKLVIKQEKFIEKDKDAIIYLEDASSSMNKGLNFIACKSIHKLLCEDPRPVYYYRFSNNIETYELNTLEEKIKVFSQPKKYTETQGNYKKLFELVQSNHKKGNVILSTDGEDLLDGYLNNISLKFYIVMRIKNNDLINLCRKTGGQFLII